MYVCRNQLSYPCQLANQQPGEESVSYHAKMPKDGGLRPDPLRDPFLRVKRAPVDTWTPPGDQKVAKNTAPTVKAMGCRERVVTFFGTWH